MYLCKMPIPLDRGAMSPKGVMVTIRRGGGVLLYSGIVARGCHWDGHWHADCPARASRDSDSPYGDRNAWRCPPCGGAGGSGAWGRVVREGVLGDVPSLAHTGHKEGCASGRQRGWGGWDVCAWA